MKVLLALAVLTTSAVSMAANDRAIYDIMYLPVAGTTFGITEAGYLKQTVEGENNLEVDVTGYGLSQTLGHSITDRLLLNAQLNYANIDYDGESSFGETEYSRVGIGDLEIGARFRTIDETLKWDILGGATIGLGDREEDEEGDENNYQGGHSLFVGTQIGTKTEGFQWAILGSLKHNLESTTDSDIDGKYDADAHNELTVRGDILNRIVENSFLRSFVSADFIEGYDEEDGAEVDAPTTVYTIGTEFQQLLSQDLLLRAGVDYSKVNVDSGSFDKFDQWTFSLAANYQF